jgi:AcrR family transcriptional regulator
MVSRMSHPQRTRRSQAERSAITRASLLEATEACLIEAGFAGTTTTEVAHRAGVSLGALLHHFPTKVDLLIAAVRRAFDARLSEYRKAVADLPEGSDRIDAGVDLLWSAYTGPTFVACLELCTAARTDPGLVEEVGRLNDWFIAESRVLFLEQFSDTPAIGEEALRIGHFFTLVVMDGLALHKLFPGTDNADPLSVLAILKNLGHQLLGAPPDEGKKR